MIDRIIIDQCYCLIDEVLELIGDTFPMFIFVCFKFSMVETVRLTLDAGFG